LVRGIKSPQGRLGLTVFQMHWGEKFLVFWEEEGKKKILRWTVWDRGGRGQEEDEVTTTHNDEDGLGFHVIYFFFHEGPFK